MEGTDSPASPLAGLTVVECSTYVAGPLSGLVLRQLGATVIRVEPPGGAADRRRWPLHPGGHSLYWAGLNAGKRSVELDLRTGHGRSALIDLLVDSGPGGGILITNTHDSLSSVVEQARPRRPDLIYIALSGRADGTPAVDYTIQAATGCAELDGRDGRPVVSAIPTWDLCSGLYIVVGLLAAVRERESTGVGRDIRLSLEDVALSSLDHLGLLTEAKIAPRESHGNHLYGGFGRDFTCADGHRVMIATLTDVHWRRLVAATGMETELSRLADRWEADLDLQADRTRHRVDIGRALEPWFATRTLEDVGRRLDEHGVLWDLFTDLREMTAAAWTRVRDNPLFATVEHPGVGVQHAAGLPLMMDGAWHHAGPAPEIGEAEPRDVLHTTPLPSTGSR